MDDQDLLLASQDYQKLERTHVKAGFREGVEEGKKDAMERGFKRGFKDGVHASVRWARLSGRLSALEMYLRQQDRCLSDELCQLKEKVETLRRQGGGGVGDDGTDSEERPLWEVLEQSKPSEDLLKYEQQVEDAIHRLEDFSS